MVVNVTSDPLNEALALITSHEGSLQQHRRNRGFSRTTSLEHRKGDSLPRGLARGRQRMRDMQVAPLPPDETERLAALHQLAVLDSPPTESLDRITRLAADSLKLPIVLVSLVAADRQWFNSRVGLEVSGTSRDVSFCAHAVAQRSPLIICDTAKDPRFSDNPLVTGPPYFRAYMGIPLLTLQAHPIGTMCAIDVEPRDFTTVEQELLTTFAKIVEETFHAREVANQTQNVLRYARSREQLFRETFELAAVGMTHAALSGKLLRANQRACEMLGYTGEELREIQFIDITHPDDVAEEVDLFRQLIGGSIQNYRMEKRLLRKDGQYQWVYLSVAVKRDEAGQPEYLIAVIEDIAAKKLAESELVITRDTLQVQVKSQTQRMREQNQTLRSQIIQVLTSESAQRHAEARLRAITNNVPAMIGYWNRELRNEFANSGYRLWFGFAPEQVVGMSMQQLMGPEMFAKSSPHARLALEGHEQHFERTMTKTDGTKSITDVRYLPDFDEAGDVRGFYVLATDVTPLRTAQAELEKLNLKLEQESTTDYLTGIANRRIFTRRSEAAAAQLRDLHEPYGLILLDIDNFKRVNDRYGHEVGDEVLGTLGRLLRDQLRAQDDLAARLGGEEFAVMCFGSLSEEGLCAVAERIREQIKLQSIPTQEGLIHITCSFGVSLGDRCDADWKRIYARADAALYEAKHSGKDRVVCGRAGSTHQIHEAVLQP